VAELVDGAPARDDAERDLAALLAETRALEPGAPEALRERVRALAAGAPSPAPQGPVARWRARLRAADRRRLLAVAAPVAVAALVAAIVIPVLGGSDGAPVRSGAPAELRSDAGDAAVPQAERVVPAAPPGPGAAAPVPGGATGPAPDAGRAQVVSSWTRVRVDGVDALSRASTRAMAAVRRLGGYTASSDYDVLSGEEGTNRLVLRVPVARVDEALAAFGRLGTVIGQRSEIVDVTGRLDAQTRRIERLGARIGRLRDELAARPGDAALQAEVARLEAARRTAEDRRAALRRRAELATLSLTLTTAVPPPAPADEGRFVGPLSDAGDRLAGAAAWLLGAIALLGPFMLVAGAAAWGAVRLRRRGARRLMSRA
jgi:hypothetical protein